MRIQLNIAQTLLKRLLALPYVAGVVPEFKTFRTSSSVERTPDHDAQMEYSELREDILRFLKETIE